MKLIRLLCGLLLAGVLIAEGLAFALVWRLKMLPNEYLVALAAFLLVLWVVLAALLFLPGKKKRTPGKGRIVCVSLLVAVILLGCGMASDMVAKLHETLQHISTPTELTANVDLYVRVEDPAQSVSDTAGYVFAITENYDMENTRKAIAQLEAELGSKITTVNYSNYFEVVDAVLEGQADALLLNSAYITLMQEAEGYRDFSAKARLLKQFNITITVQNPEDDDTKNPSENQSGNTEDPDPTNPGTATQPTKPDTSIKIPDGDVTKTPFVVYLAGCDYDKGGLGVWSRNDVNILAVVNPVTKQVLLINTPRDYYVPNPAGNGAMDKLTHCGIKTVSNSQQAMSQFYEVPIRYYAQIGFDGVEALVDAVDGITVYSDVSYLAMGETWIQKGNNYLDGEQALHFARERKNVDGGDNVRGNNQMKIIKALINKMLSGKLISKYTEILDSVKGLFRTDMPMETMASLVQMQLSDMASWNIISYAVTGESGYSRECYEMPGPPLFVYYPNMDTVEYAKELMQRVVDGEIIKQSDIIPAE